MSTHSNWHALSGKSILAATVAGFVFLPSSDANAGTRQFTAELGQPYNVATIRSWNNADCQSYHAKADVVVHPKHGVVSARVVDATIQPAIYGTRATTGRPDPKCVGRPIKGLYLDYTSAEGFHGMDVFSLYITYSPTLHETITYTMTVQ